MTPNTDPRAARRALAAPADPEALILLPAVQSVSHAERLAAIADPFRQAFRARPSLRSIAKTLNAQGTPSPAGGRWTAKSVSRVAQAMGLYAPTPRGPRGQKNGTEAA